MLRKKHSKNKKSFSLFSNAFYCIYIVCFHCRNKSTDFYIENLSTKWFAAKFLDLLCKFFLTETTSFTFRFQKTEDIVLTNGTLDVTDDGTVSIIHEFNADLGNTTTRTGTAENLSNSSELDRSLRGVL